MGVTSTNLTLPTHVNLKHYGILGPERAGFSHASAALFLLNQERTEQHVDTFNSNSYLHLHNHLNQQNTWQSFTRLVWRSGVAEGSMSRTQEAHSNVFKECTPICSEINSAGFNGTNSLESMLRTASCLHGSSKRKATFYTLANLHPILSRGLGWRISEINEFMAVFYPCKWIRMRWWW